MEKALETLRRVGDGVMQKHELAFQGMLRKLEIQQEEDLQSVMEVAAHVFSDGVTNWGRVVTLISFGAFVAKHLKSIKQEQSISSLAGIITDALVSSKREWLESQGGWEGFVDFFRVEDLEGSIRNVLMAFAGVAGLGASLAYMIRNPLYLVEDKSVMENSEPSTVLDTSENPEHPQATLIPGLLNTWAAPGIHPWGYPGAASWLDQPSMARQDTPELEQLL
ncbi:hypothetical protein HGM15179_007103 [Zosterops borbonicus]|uniref:Bcl-2 Bcl-2 homology region 1-3 domain-containing protein n=1 Tax=Zosterops borbonicus TaxID=364589 RepID=A0A8K1LN02_9PASS|nr:hypothetical protein HGM15179_007103 [Zosterops borbonicus]